MVKSTEAGALLLCCGEGGGARRVMPGGVKGARGVFASVCCSPTPVRRRDPNADHQKTPVTRVLCGGGTARACLPPPRHTERSSAMLTCVDLSNACLPSPFLPFPLPPLETQTQPSLPTSATRRDDNLQSL